MEYMYRRLVGRYGERNGECRVKRSELEQARQVTDTMEFEVRNVFVCCSNRPMIILSLI